MATSKEIPSAERAYDLQYNDHRTDAVNDTAGHKHDGVDGKKLASSAISPQPGTLDADKLDGVEGSSFCQVDTGTFISKPAPATAGRIYMPTDLKGLFMIEDGSDWHYICADAAEINYFETCCLVEPSPDAEEDHGPDMTFPVKSGGSIIKVTGQKEGIWELATDTSQGSFASCAFDNVGSYTHTLISARAPIVMRALVKYESGETGQRMLRFGLVNTGQQLTEPADGVYFIVGHAGSADNDWHAVVKSGGATLADDDSGVLSTADHLLEIFINSASSITFFIDGVLKHTTSFTTTTNLQMELAISKNNTASGGIRKMRVKGIQYFDKAGVS